MIRDKLNFSMTDKELKEKLLEMENHSLESIKDKIIAAETTRYEINLMAHDVKEEKRIEAAGYNPKMMLSLHGGKNSSSITLPSSSKLIRALSLQIQFGIKETKVQGEVFVTDDKTCPILGLKTAVQMGLVQKGSNASATIDTVCKDSYKGFTRDDVTLEEHAPKVNAPRRVAHKLIKPLEEKIKDMVKQGVVEEVEHPTEWVNNFMSTEKKDGTIGLCLDPTELNKYIKREHFTIPTFQEIIAKLRKLCFFTIIDQSSAFWQIELEEDCRDVTTFQTNSGRYRFKRMPFGILSASEVLQKKAFQILGDTNNMHIVADEMLIVGDTEKEHDECLLAVLERAKLNNIKFNERDLQVKKKEVVYCGTKLSVDGIQADPSKAEAIQKIPDPNNKQDAQRLFGMVNYLSPFISNKTQVTEPLKHRARL
eukprot:gene17626-9267_t